MRETVFANCESAFVETAIKKQKRLDGRLFDELRNIELHFGSDYGCTYVTLGETKVLAHVSCELSEPRNARKNEGNLFVNVEINDMVCGVFETGYHNHLGVHTNRLIEKCIKDSRCVDLEALCIISEEQAWEIRVDVSVLNYDGNLFTCSSLAALAALAHFRTPHVSLENSGVRIESIKDYEPEPLSLHHYPILVAFAIFGEGDDILTDPTELEEKVCESELVIGMNSFRELCGMHFSGRTTGNRSLIVKAAQQAAVIAVDLVKLMKSKLQLDTAERENNRGKTEGLVSAIHLDRILSASQDRNSLKVTRREIEETTRSLIEDRKMAVTGMDSDDEQVEQSDDKMFENDEREIVHSKDKRMGVQLQSMEKIPFGKQWIPSGNKNAWTLPNATLSDDESGGEDDVGYVKTITDEDRIIDRIELNDSDEEKDTVMLGAKEADSGMFRSDQLEENYEHLPRTSLIASDRQFSGDQQSVGVSENANFLPANDSSSYSMTSPSYSSDSSLHSSSTSSISHATSKPNYNPPKGEWAQPSTSFCRIPSPKIRKKFVRAYSPSSPSSDSSEKYEKTGDTIRRPAQQDRRSTAFSTSTPIQPAACSTNPKNDIRNRRPASSAVSKRIRCRPLGRFLGATKAPFKSRKQRRDRNRYLDSLGNIKTEPESDGKEHHITELTSNPNNRGLQLVSELQFPLAKNSPSSKSKPRPSNLPLPPDFAPSTPALSYPLCSPMSPTILPMSLKPDPSASNSRSKTIPSPSYTPSSPSKPPPTLSCPPSSTSQVLHSPVYSPSSPSLPCSPTSCRNVSPHISPTTVKKRLSSSSNSFPDTSVSIPFSTRSPNSQSKLILSPEYSPSSTIQSLSSKNHPSPEYTPSSPSKLPPSPAYSPSFQSESPSPSWSPDQSWEESTPQLPRDNQSPADSQSPSGSENSSPMYSPVSSQSPAYSSGSSRSSKVLRKRVKLQRSSPTSPGSVVSELLNVRVSGTKKIDTYSPSSSPKRFILSEVGLSGNGSLDLSVPSPKYSPSSRLLSSDVSGATIPPYSPSSPSHPPPSPSIDLSSPPSPTFTRSSDPEFGTARNHTPELGVLTRPKAEKGEFGSPHDSLDSLSSYSSSSFSSGLPSPSSGSPRYSPSPSESLEPNRQQLTPSPPLSPSITFTSPRVSSSSSSTPPPTNPASPMVANLKKDTNLVHPSLIVFSPSVSPDLPQFSPSSPSHQPPSPAYSPSSPSYSSRSCSPLESNASIRSENTQSSSSLSPASNSTTSTHTRTVVLKVFIPKSS